MNATVMFQLREEVAEARKAQEEELRNKIEEDFKRSIGEQVRREELQKLETVRVGYTCKTN